MSTKKANTKAEPAKIKVTPTVPTVLIDGKTYTLDFSFPALAAAERAFLSEGHYVNLLFALSVTTLNLNRTADLFAAAVRTHHPELGYDGAVALVRTETLYDIANAAFAALKGKAA